MLDGLAGDSLCPENDIAVGCFSATYALQGYLLDEMRAQATTHSEVGIAVHVDDTSQEAVATNANECAGIMAQAARDPESALHDELSTQVADAKGTTLRNSDTITQEGQRRAA